MTVEDTPSLNDQRKGDSALGRKLTPLSHKQYLLAQPQFQSTADKSQSTG